MSSTIATYLRRERRTWGLSQKELARLLGFRSRAYVSALERGLAMPSARVLIALSLIFGMNAGQLFPQLTEETEGEVLRSAAALVEAMDADATLRATRKITLLRQIPSRAVMS